MISDVGMRWQQKNIQYKGNGGLCIVLFWKDNESS